MYLGKKKIIFVSQYEFRSGLIDVYSTLNNGKKFTVLFSRSTNHIIDFKESKMTPSLPLFKSTCLLFLDIFKYMKFFLHL